MNIIKKIYLSAFIFLYLISSLMILSSCKEKQPQKISKGVVVLKVGDVKLHRDKTEIIPRVKQDVFPGDIITTAKNSYIVFQLNNLGVFRIYQNTKIALSSKVMQNSIQGMDLSTGSVFSKLMKLKKKQEFSINTPTSVAAVRGTEFMVSNENNNPKTFVSKGKVELKVVVSDKNKKKKEIKTLLDAGEMGYVSTKNKINTRPLKKVEKLILKKGSIFEYNKEIKKQEVASIQKINKKQIQKLKVIEKKIEVVKEIGLTPLQKLQKKGKVLTKLHLTDGSKLIGYIYDQDENSIKLDTGEGKIDLPKESIIRREKVK